MDDIWPANLRHSAGRHGIVATAALALFLAGCGETNTAATATPFTGMTVESLIRPPDAEPFEVIFEYTKGVPGGDTGVFVWRQDRGRRRWDAVSRPGYKQGRFLSTDGFVAGVGSDPAAGRDCTWDGFRNGSNVQSPFVQCGGEVTGIGLMGAISSTLAGGVSRRLADRTIAGVSANCYEIARLGKSDATLCVDITRRIPLAFEGSYGGEIRAVEATDVADDPGPLTAEINDPTAASASNTNLLLATLDLPRAITDSLTH